MNAWIALSIAVVSSFWGCTIYYCLCDWIEWNAGEEGMGATLYGWAKCGATYAMANGWRQAPEVVDEDVTGQVEIRDGHMGKCLYFNKVQVGGFCFPIEPRKNEMYDLPEDWPFQWSRKGWGDLVRLDISEWLKQFRKPTITVWRKGEK